MPPPISAPKSNLITIRLFFMPRIGAPPNNHKSKTRTHNANAVFRFVAFLQSVGMGRAEDTSGGCEVIDARRLY